MAISIRGKFGLLVSRTAERGTFNGARVHAESSRELRQVIGVPREPKRDRDDACLGEAGRRHLARFSDQGEEFLVA
jgi:hypothetical protein